MSSSLGRKKPGHIELLLGYSLKKKHIFIYLFLERGEGREKERKRNIYVGEKHWMGCLSHIPTWSATQECALTKNWTGDLAVCGMVPHLLSHTSQGSTRLFCVGLYVIFLPFILILCDPQNSMRSECFGTSYTWISKCSKLRLIMIWLLGICWPSIKRQCA